MIAHIPLIVFNCSKLPDEKLLPVHQTERNSGEKLGVLKFLTFLLFSASERNRGVKMAPVVSGPSLPNCLRLDQTAVLGRISSFAWQRLAAGLQATDLFPLLKADEHRAKCDTEPDRGSLSSESNGEKLCNGALVGPELFSAGLLVSGERLKSLLALQQQPDISSLLTRLTHTHRLADLLKSRLFNRIDSPRLSWHFLPVWPVFSHIGSVACGDIRCCSRHCSGRIKSCVRHTTDFISSRDSASLHSESLFFAILHVLDILESNACFVT
ncbi:hypothetical protein F2P81_015256 [Scophthalmus maximus]|uniref:Uncharacterized protein n=1 Tax=Scophthalmus maximus TaxID=52904 RepID=A0A6A4SCU1_SCOMX|nr:hypothetical protein F2P81_015256 [Scophthalmus maximus]